MRTPDGGNDSGRSITERHTAMILFLIGLLVIGLIAGFIARALVPGPDPMGIGGTILLGVVGSFLGGLLGYLLFGHDIDDGAVQASGIFRISDTMGRSITAMVSVAAVRPVFQYWTLMS